MRRLGKAGPGRLVGGGVFLWSCHSSAPQIVASCIGPCHIVVMLLRCHLAQSAESAREGKTERGMTVPIEPNMRLMQFNARQRVDILFTPQSIGNGANLLGGPGDEYHIG